MASALDEQLQNKSPLGTEMPGAHSPHPEAGKALWAHALSFALDTVHLSATSSFRSQLTHHLLRKDSLITMFFFLIFRIFHICSNLLSFVYYHHFYLSPLFFSLDCVNFFFVHCSFPSLTHSRHSINTID